MNTLSYKTKSANDATVERRWIIVDAEGEVVGRLASQIAHLLRGKHKPYYTPHVDCGDHVIVINADKVRFTGQKMTNKVYLRHTGYPGGQRSITPAELLARKPFAVIEKAVKGMLPKNRLGRAMFRKLHVYAGADHPHTAQKPETYNPIR
ncbi:MAG: 50S ribosomal protein L13 [Bacteroidota bacterium]